MVKDITSKTSTGQVQDEGEQTLDSQLQSSAAPQQRP